MRGQPVLRIANTYDVSPSSLKNHCDHHLSRQLVQAYEKKRLEEGTDILGGIEDLLHRTKSILDTAEKDQKYHLALNAIREGRESYKLLSQIAHALHEARTKELELEQQRQAQDQSQNNDQAREMLSVLEQDELKIYERLTRKIRTQNPDLKALPNKNRPLPDLDAYITADGNWEIQDRPQPERKRASQPDPEPDSEPEIEVDEETETETVPANRSTEIPSTDTDPEWMKRERRRYL